MLTHQLQGFCAVCGLHQLLQRFVTLFFRFTFLVHHLATDQDEYSYTDEGDDEERTYVVLNDHTWIFEAKTQLTDFYKIAKVDEDEFEKVVGDADTLAGMLLEIKGEFPALHEKVTYHNYEFEVLEMDSRRILKVKFTILPKEMEDGVVSAV